MSATTSDPTPAPTLAVATMRLLGDASTWSWTPEAFALHGFGVGEVVPTTALLLSHVHPEDRSRWSAVLEGSGAVASPVVVRLRRGDGETRFVLGLRRAGLDAVEVDLVDLTPLVLAEGSRVASEQIAAAAVSRATIEQAKGVLAAAFGVGADAAFAILREASMRTNVSLRELAARVVTHVARRGRDTRLALDLAPLLQGAGESLS